MSLKKQAENAYRMVKLGESKEYQEYMREHRRKLATLRAQRDGYLGVPEHPFYEAEDDS